MWDWLTLFMLFSFIRVQFLCVCVCGVWYLSLCVPVCADARDQPHIVFILFYETESLACLELAEMGSLVESISVFPDLIIQV